VKQGHRLVWALTVNFGVLYHTLPLKLAEGHTSAIIAMLISTSHDTSVVCLPKTIVLYPSNSRPHHHILKLADLLNPSKQYFPFTNAAICSTSPCLVPIPQFITPQLTKAASSHSYFEKHSILQNQQFIFSSIRILVVT
jgi:hypothetical protein